MFKVQKNRLQSLLLTAASRFFSGKNKLKLRTSDVWKEMINGSKKNFTGGGENIIS